MKKYFMLFMIILFAVITNPSFSQDTTDDPAKNEDRKAVGITEMQAAFEKAMREIAADKEKEQEKMLAMLKEKLSAASQEWIAEANKKWEGNLNQYVEQNWETLGIFGVTPHSDYYLRDFEYIENGIDIIKTDSLMVPYKGYVNLTEKLYVEQYHTPDASDVAIFFYTFTDPIIVSFEYRGDRFALASVEHGTVRLDQGWPRTIRELRDKHGERFRTAAH